MSLFGGGPLPFQEDVEKATDENLTTEPYDKYFDLVDKIKDEDGARQVVAATQKRFSHRNPNVQLYTLSLVDFLSKNVTPAINVHRELSSRSFTSSLAKLAEDRNTVKQVKERVLQLMAEWADEFDASPEAGTLDLMRETLNGLAAKDIRPPPKRRTPPPEPDADRLRAEEEELQRVLEMSKADTGGRGAHAGWVSDYPAPSPTNAPASSSAAAAIRSSSLPDGPSSASVPAGRAAVAPSAVGAGAGAGAGVAGGLGESGAAAGRVKRVRALFDFAPQEPNELAFVRGDVIRVVETLYREWWKGELRGRVGIFPVNYVEKLPDPTPTQLAAEVEAESALFASAGDIDRLLQLLQSVDPTRENIADNEEIQELYDRTLRLRPKIVKLIDKYSRKRDDLVTMNETFTRARGIFEQMMESTMARHQRGRYDYSQPAPQQGYGWYAGQQAQAAAGPAGPSAQPQAAGYPQSSYPAQQQPPPQEAYYNGAPPQAGPPTHQAHAYPAEQPYAPQPQAPQSQSQPQAPPADGAPQAQAQPQKGPYDDQWAAYYAAQAAAAAQAQAQGQPPSQPQPYAAAPSPGAGPPAASSPDVSGQPPQPQAASSPYAQPYGAASYYPAPGPSDPAAAPGPTTPTPAAAPQLQVHEPSPTSPPVPGAPGYASPPPPGAPGYTSPPPPQQAYPQQQGAYPVQALAGQMAGISLHDPGAVPPTGQQKLPQ